MCSAHSYLPPSIPPSLPPLPTRIKDEFSSTVTGTLGGDILLSPSPTSSSLPPSPLAALKEKHLALLREDPAFVHYQAYWGMAGGREGGRAGGREGVVGAEEEEEEEEEERRRLEAALQVRKKKRDKSPPPFSYVLPSLPPSLPP